MASPTDTNFGLIAGQEIAGGIRTTPYNTPVITFGTSLSKTGLANLSNINGLIPKIGRTIIHDTMVFRNPLDRIFNQLTDPYGVATEHAAFLRSAVNKLNEGVCAPTGNVAMTSQLTASNFAWNIPIEIYDREINGALLSAEDITRYVSQKMRTMEKAINEARFTAEKIVLSNATAGKRTIASSTKSDGTGTAVSYSAQIPGYAGKIVDKSATWTIPEIARFTDPDIQHQSGTAQDVALEMLYTLKNAAADMAYPATDANKLGINNFNGGRPWLVMETKVLNAFDAAVAQDTDSAYGYAGVPSISARAYISEFADLVEIDAFAALPDYDSTITGSTDYTGKRLGAVLLDKDAPWAITKFDDMEAQRCAGRRSTSYSAMGEQDLAIYEGAPSYALIVDA